MNSVVKFMEANIAALQDIYDETGDNGYRDEYLWRSIDDMKDALEDFKSDVGEIKKLI